MNTTAHADATWELFQELMSYYRSRLPKVAAELEIPPSQAHALLKIDPDRELTMSDVADRLCCDPSNVTGVIDRLESRGLVRREPTPQDRRVKALELTGEGKRLREKLRKKLHEAPEEIASLGPTDQAELRRLLRLVLRHI